MKWVDEILEASDELFLSGARDIDSASDISDLIKAVRVMEKALEEVSISAVYNCNGCNVNKNDIHSALHEVEKIRNT